MSNYYEPWRKLPIDWLATGKSTGKLILSFAIPIALLYTTYVGIGNKIEYSEGTKIGVVSDISKKGVFWKTYEGQMLENLSSNQNWSFSIDSQSKDREGLAKQLQAYFESGQKIKITYIELLATLPWRSSTDYLIQTVEPGLEQILKQDN